MTAMIIKILFFLYSISMALKLGFFFDGSTRYIPLRVTILLSIILAIFYLPRIKNIQIKKTHILYILLYISLGLIYIFIWLPSSISIIIKNLIELAYPLLVLFNLYCFTLLLNKNYINKGLLIFLYLSIILISIETLIRFYWPEFAFKGEISEFLAEKNRNSLYIYKYGSIMYLDSNYTALHILALLGITLTSSHITSKLRFITFIIITILLIGTLSRAAYIAYLAIIYIYILFRISTKNRLVILLITFVSLVIISIGNSHFLPNDISFNSKLLIFKSLLKAPDIPMINLLFGYGFIDGGYIYSFREGAYAHALLPLLLGEVGIIGLLLYVTGLIVIIYKHPKDIGLIVLPIIICGFSLVYPWDAIYIYIIYIYLKLKKQTVLTS